MGNGYFEEMNMGNMDKRSRSAAAAATRRRGRKSGGVGEKPKPKRPQRGLGVAQLEKIRLHAQIMGCASYGRQYFFSNLSAGMEEYERGSFRYGDSQPTTSIRWEPSNTFLETTQHFGQQNMIGHLFNPHLQDSMHKNKNTKYGRDSIGSSSCHNYESYNETQELDLELRL